MRAIPPRSEDTRDLPGPDAPVGPCEDRAADEQEEKGAREQVFHV